MNLFHDSGFIEFFRLNYLNHEEFIVQEEKLRYKYIIKNGNYFKHAKSKSFNKLL